ncbi:MAG: hypothetical protein U0457_07095 [Candidatus Sericytochromatia bacterium]
MLKNIKIKYLALTIIPIIFSCNNPNSNTPFSLNSKSEALKHFECALNNPNISENDKNTIKNLVITQINALTDETWEKVKTNFETYFKNYSCNALPSSSPSLSPIPSSLNSSPLTNNTSIVSLPTKEDFIKALNCISLNKELKDLAKIEIASYLNASRFLDDKTYNLQRSIYENLISRYNYLCESNSNPTASPSFTPITNNGITEYSCEAEKTLKSSTGTSINLSFINNSGNAVKLYWLDFNGNRMIYNRNMLNTNTHKQQTFVTHPWVVTDANDKCLKIFVPSDVSANNSEINIK